MFTESLLESSRKVEKRRGLTALLAAALQSGLVLVVLAVPLFLTERLQIQPVAAAIIAPMPRRGEQKPARRPPTERPPTTDTTPRDAFQQPREIPNEIDLTPEQPSADSVASDIGSNLITDGVPWGDPNSVVPYIPDTRPAIPPTPVRTEPLIVSEATLGKAIHRVAPRYPDIARRIRLQGDVILRALVGADGRVKDVQVVSGNPVLVREAEQTVRQWRYRPYMLNGQPIEVESIVTVRFTLN
jgi:periplasmic protein TonB